MRRQQVRQLASRELQGDDMMIGEESMDELCDRLDGTMGKVESECAESVASVEFPICIPAQCTAAEVEEFVEDMLMTNDEFAALDCTIDVKSSAPMHFSIFHVAGATIATLSMALM